MLEVLGGRRVWVALHIIGDLDVKSSITYLGRKGHGYMYYVVRNRRHIPPRPAIEVKVMLKIVFMHVRRQTQLLTLICSMFRPGAKP